MLYQILTVPGKRFSIFRRTIAKNLGLLAPISLLMLPMPPKPPHTVHHGIRLWTNRSTNLAKYDQSRWHGAAPLLTGQFYLLGFSKDGWLAYTDNKDGNGAPYEKSGRVSLLNIQCLGGGECVTDTPTSKGDKCYCPETTANHLWRFHITRLRNPVSGSFPARIDDYDYGVEMVFKEKLIYSEAAPLPGGPSGPEFPGTEIYLVSKSRGKQLIQVVDHNHSGIVPGSIQIAGWVQDPFEQSIVVVFGGVLNSGADSQGRMPVQFFPAAASLKTGFTRK
ncbi:MAG: hypothetical protein ACREDR_47125 [Blastocatellia bacterium]